MKFLISGGAGFIGSHLTESVLNDGHEAVVIDNFSTGREDNIRRLQGKRLTVVKADVSAFRDIERYFRGIDIVFHIAALADIVPSIERPIDYLRSNVDGTVAMLEASRRNGVKKFVYAASSSCYGIPGKFPTDEGAEIRPGYPYALTKYMGEQCVMHWGKVYKLPVISLRLFNVYGPRSRTSGTYGAVFGVFLAQRLAGEPFTVVGDGRQTRDFVFITDAVRAFRMAAASGLSGGIFNVGSGRPSSINRLTELLGGDKIYIPKRPGEPDRTHADIRKISRMLGWRPQVSFEKGVSVMLEKIEYWRGAPVWTPEEIERATKDWFEFLSARG